MNSLELVDAGADSAAPSQAAINEALVFQLDGQEYGMALQAVREIRSFEAPTRLAGAPADVLGVLDLRGEVIPLIDLRRRFGLPSVPFDAFTIVIVVSLGERCVGVVADRVSDVVQLQPQQVRPMPAMNGVPSRRHLIAIAALEGRTIVLTDIVGLVADGGADLALAAAA